MTFEGRYKQLNEKQRQAVDCIDGPVMVIAGPGTGKTELLSMRIANILKQTDILPDNILCLTFTENGAKNMRERLNGLIGQSAYRIHVSTYHGFGAEMIRRFPEYFLETRMQEPVDDLGRHQLLTDIVERMSYLNPLKQTRHHLGDLISTISEVKRALLTSNNLRTIAESNTAFIAGINKDISKIFDDFVRMPSSIDKALPYFEKTHQLIKQHPAIIENTKMMSLSSLALDKLATALEAAQTSRKTTALTEWKNEWLIKNAANQFILSGELENKRIKALANVIDDYQQALEKRGLYDFDDMILRSIASLEKNDDLKYTLQEQYQFLLLDEFQDTNAVQLRLVELLTDNPVHEGRPNVLAVGDDDQAIYAFQGAQYSNMLDFYKMYNDVAVINLQENYRSHPDILTTAQNIATQINERLHHQFNGLTKQLNSANKQLPKNAHITRNEFKSDIAQYAWVANEINVLIQKGVQPKEIAVLAPKHRQLEPIVPYLNNLGVPVSYERRENILEVQVIKQIITISRLVLAVKNGQHQLANALWPEVLSYEFWKISTSTVWQLAWQVTDSDDDSYTWNKAVLDETSCRQVGLLVLSLASRVESESLESMLDWIIGTQVLATHDEKTASVRSPLREHYTGSEVMKNNPQLFYETLSHLKVLRERLRDFQRAHDKALTLKDLIIFVDMYHDAGQQIINTSPYNQDKDAIQVMTVFKAKGLEYQHVFLVSCNDDVWGSSSRGNNNKLTLPANLMPIRHAGATDDERLRILFVALTRAKFGLHLTSFTHTYSGKATKRLSYLNEQEQDDGLYYSHVLPQGTATVYANDHKAPEISSLDLDWHVRHTDALTLTKLRSLLEERLQSYMLSPTHLNSFTSTDHAGPEVFFFRTILRFPEAPTIASTFGNAMHDTMEWIQHTVDARQSVPPIAKVITAFQGFLKARKLPADQESIELERGEKALRTYLSARSSIFKPGDKAEQNFASEGVFIGEAHLCGKIDRLEINRQTKEITVVDYKTGKPFDRWKADAKLHRYKQQLYFYKLLIENTRTYSGYSIKNARLEFLEPDDNDRIMQLELTFNQKELERTKHLISTVWRLIQDLHFPDTSRYDKSLKGIQQFEHDLLTATPKKV